MQEYLKPGLVLGEKYEVLDLLGKGGMGQVYKARHRDLDIKVAVKVLHADEAGDPKMLSRFRTEARSAASIKHPNVVEVTDFGVTQEGRPFFVMELLKGESLADRLDRRGSLPEREAVEIVDQILSGLSGAHRRRIIHRDLKPENVLFTRNDLDREVVKLLDFGIAKLVGGSMPSQSPEPSDRPQTHRGFVLGTPGYMAPEAITGRGKQDERSDLFSVGVLLYEMICGRRPFTGSTPHEIMMAAATKPVPRPKALRPGISEAMDRLILTALAKFPEDRFQSADEFVYHLTAAAVGRIPHNARQCRTKYGPAPTDLGSPDDLGDTQDDLIPLDLGRSPGPNKPKRVRPNPLDGYPVARSPYNTPARKPRRKKLSSPVSPIIIIIILALAAAVYYLFFYQSPIKTVGHDEAGRIHERHAEPTHLNAEPDEEPEQ